MDIRRYVHVKKLPGGDRGACEYVEGVVLTKNLQHRDMRQRVDHPKILLLGFPVEFQQPTQNALSIDTVRVPLCRPVSTGTSSRDRSQPGHG
jgi:1-phosphatidylinositol-3-phosphate 5-kinase